MTKLRLWQVDAFAAKPLEGNPAAIVPLDRWLDEGLMQKIAGENNVAETAFFVKPAQEVTTCAGSRQAAKSICAAMPRWPAIS